VKHHAKKKENGSISYHNDQKEGERGKGLPPPRGRKGRGYFSSVKGARGKRKEGDPRGNQELSFAWEKGCFC